MTTDLELLSPALDWLLESPEPAVARMARRDLLGEDSRRHPRPGPWTRALLAEPVSGAGFGVHPYRKWTGAHWRLVSLVELEVDPRHAVVRRAAQTVLDWLTGDRHRSRIVAVDGLFRRCASQEGNALAVASRLGLAADERVRLLADSLIEWQWPDGGWNCDVRASGHRSSFHETLPAMWGLWEHSRARHHPRARTAAMRAAELLLDHRVYFSSRGEVIDRTWTALHFPPYWHYDVLQALLILSRMGLAADLRTGEALDLLERRRRQDGRWRPGGYWWRPPGSPGPNVDVVDWGRSAPNPMITLNALRVLRAAGRA